MDAQTGTTTPTTPTPQKPQKPQSPVESWTPQKPQTERPQSPSEAAARQAATRQAAARTRPQNPQAGDGDTWPSSSTYQNENPAYDDGGHPYEQNRPSTGNRPTYDGAYTGAFPPQQQSSAWNTNYDPNAMRGMASGAFPPPTAAQNNLPDPLGHGRTPKEKRHRILVIVAAVALSLACGAAGGAVSGAIVSSTTGGSLSSSNQWGGGQTGSQGMMPQANSNGLSNGGSSNGESSNGESSGGSSSGGSSSQGDSSSSSSLDDSYQPTI